MPCIWSLLERDYSYNFGEATSFTFLVGVFQIFESRHFENLVVEMAYIDWVATYVCESFTIWKKIFFFFSIWIVSLPFRQRRHSAFWWTVLCPLSTEHWTQKSSVSFAGTNHAFLKARGLVFSQGSLAKISTSPIAQIFVVSLWGSATLT